MRIRIINEEIQETIAHLEGRIKKIRAAQDGIKKLLKKEGYEKWNLLYELFVLWIPQR